MRPPHPLSPPEFFPKCDPCGPRRPLPQPVNTQLSPTQGVQLKGTCSPALHICVRQSAPPPSRAQDTDAALLCVVGFPAFAIDSQKLAEQTYDRVLETLEVCPFTACLYLLHTSFGFTSTPLVCVCACSTACCYALLDLPLGELWANEIHERHPPHCERGH